MKLRAIVSMVSARARAVVSNASARPSVTLLRSFSRRSGVTPAIALVMPSTVPRKPRIGTARVLQVTTGDGVGGQGQVEGVENAQAQGQSKKQGRGEAIETALRALGRGAGPIA